MVESRRSSRSKMPRLDPGMLGVNSSFKSEARRGPVAAEQAVEHQLLMGASGVRPRGLEAAQRIAPSTHRAEKVCSLMLFIWQVPATANRPWWR